MCKQRLGAAVVLGVLAASSLAPARSDRRTGDAVVVEAIKQKMAVFVTPDGSYVAISTDTEKKQVFHGNSHDLYRQRVLISAVDEDDNLSILIWAPEHPRDAAIESDEDRWFLRCGTKRVELSMVDAGERSLLLRSARFRKERFQRNPYLLGRDQRGNYFYIDRQTDARGAKGFRLFIGRLGHVTKHKLKWVVSDSEGDVFATRIGELRVTTDDKGERRLLWKRKKQLEDLLSVPVAQNSYLIYKELGVYQNRSFGTPCDSH